MNELGGPIEIELNIARGCRPPLCLPRECASRVAARGRVGEFHALLQSAHPSRRRSGEPPHPLLAILDWLLQVLEPLPASRCAAADVLRHPFFWSGSSRLRLLLEVSLINLIVIVN